MFQCLGHQLARHTLDPRRPLRGVDADRFGPAEEPAADAQLHLQAGGRLLAEDQPEFGPGRVYDRVVHGVAGQPQRLGPDHPRARDHCDLGGPAAHVHHERTRARRQVDACPRGRGDRLVHQPDHRTRPSRFEGGGHRPAFHPRRAAGHCDQCPRPQRTRVPGGPVQEPVEHERGRVQVGDDPVPQRVDDLDVLRFLARQRVGLRADRGDLPGRGVDSDRGRLIDHESPARDPDECARRAQIDRDASPQAHGAHPSIRNAVCPT